MKSEQERAQRWYDAWKRVLERRGVKDAIRWQKRVVWALHRLERERRALLPPGLRCQFCERPGHDEEEFVCGFRSFVTARWNARARRWLGKEGA